MKILVTGGAGFIGSHVVDAYIEAGHQVVVFDDLSTGVKENLNLKARFFEVDICSDRAADILAKEKPHLLNHHAAQIRVDLAAKDPIKDLEINIIGLLNLMETARKGKFLKRVILASTGGAMYGNQKTPFTEGMIPQPLSPYGISKRASELYLNFYQEQYQIPYISLRYANVYGPRQNPYGEAGVVSIFCENLLNSKQPIIFGNGQQTRDYVYISDVVKANLLATQADLTGEYNIGTGIATDVNQIYQLVSHQLGSKVKAKHGPPRPGEQQISSLNCKLAKQKLNWQPQVKLEEGIKKTVSFFRQKYSQ
jgi:UDP-glucose 4-epimerase